VFLGPENQLKYGVWIVPLSPQKKPATRVAGFVFSSTLKARFYERIKMQNLAGAAWYGFYACKG
jgi:hypothetical protein